MAALEGFLVLAGVALLLAAVGTLLGVTARLAVLPAGRRALRLQAAAASAFAVTGALRAGVLALWPPMDPRVALALGLADAALAACLWLGLRELAALLAAGGAGPPRAAWPLVVVALLAYLGLSASIADLARAPVAALAQLSGVAIVAFFGLAANQLRRLLVLVDRPRAGVVAFLAVPLLGLPMFARSFARGWIGVEAVAGAPLAVLEAAGVPLAGALLLGGALTLARAVSAGQVASAATRAVLAQTATRGGAAPPAGPERPDVVQLLEGHAGLVRAAEAQRWCSVCGMPLRGLDYHNHRLAEQRPAVGIVEDAYRPLDEAERRALLEGQAAPRVRPRRR